MPENAEMLQRYVADRSEAAFAGLSVHQTPFGPGHSMVGHNPIETLKAGNRERGRIQASH
jgi:hypothetical protein